MNEVDGAGVRNLRKLNEAWMRTWREAKKSERERRLAAMSRDEWKRGRILKANERVGKYRGDMDLEC